MNPVYRYFMGVGVGGGLRMTLNFTSQMSLAVQLVFVSNLEEFWDVTQPKFLLSVAI